MNTPNAMCLETPHPKSPNYNKGSFLTLARALDLVGRLVRGGKRPFREFAFHSTPELLLGAGGGSGRGLMVQDHGGIFSPPRRGLEATLGAENCSRALRRPFRALSYPCIYLGRN